jgi:hypothetical protein
VLAIDEAQLVAEVEISRVEAVPHRDVGVHAGIPFATLHDHRRVGNEGVAADMVKMEMRVDDEIDARWVAVHHFELRTDLLPWAKGDFEQIGHPLAKPAGGVMLAIGMQAGIEQRPPFWVLDQKDRDGHGDLAFAALHQTAELAFDVTASQRV